MMQDATNKLFSYAHLAKSPAPRPLVNRIAIMFMRRGMFINIDAAIDNYVYHHELRKTKWEKFVEYLSRRW